MSPGDPRERDAAMGGAAGDPEAFPGIRRFLDGDGRLKVWPSRLTDRRLALAWLAAHFQPGVDYTERQVNQRLDRLHAFGDWALLRRELFDHGWLDRTGDGARYWRREPPPAR